MMGEYQSFIQQPNHSLRMLCKRHDVSSLNGFLVLLLGSELAVRLGEGEWGGDRLCEQIEREISQFD